MNSFNDTEEGLMGSVNGSLEVTAVSQLADAVNRSLEESVEYHLKPTDLRYRESRSGLASLSMRP